jgi:hypothetical protein
MSTISSRGNKAQKAIQLEQVGHKWFEIREFGKQLISNLGDDIFTLHSKQELLYYILKQISPINRYLKLADSSIDKACKTVIINFGLDRDAILKVSSEKGIKEFKPKIKSNTRKFCEIIIQLDKIPACVYDSLIFEVDKDLLAISELIHWYETQNCIQKNIKDNEIPKSHDDRITYDFYKRCITERMVILNYRLFGIKERAISKSRFVSDWERSVSAFSELFMDRPYYFAYPFSIQYFDCRKIDLAGHRIGDVSLDEAVKMQKLYVENKNKFYRLYFKKNPVHQHFQEFKFYLTNLPLSKNRNLIFDELIRQFKAKRWISFYALALPQVEGLFSEMCLAVSPKKDFSQKSLTHKVDSVRPYHNLSTSYFDYYQYYIPIQRNRFSHTGYDEDFKLKSFDLLVDLSHLLKIFFELDNPLVKIKKLHTRRNFEDFISLKEFVDYFKLLDSLEPEQKKSIIVDIEQFEIDFLSQDCSVDYTCNEMIQDLPYRLKEFVVEINKNFNTHGIEIKFEDLKLPEIERLLKDEKLLETMSNCLFYMNSTYETLENYSIFLKCYKRYLPSLSLEIKTELDKTKDEHSGILKSIIDTSNLILKTFKYTS